MSAPLGELLRPLDCPPAPDFLEALEARCQTAALEIPATDDAKTLAALASVAAVSPYLRALMLADPEAPCAVLRRTLAQTVEAECAVEPGADLARIGAALRRAKRRVALAVALADLCAEASVAEVTGALSRFADLAIAVALASVLQETFSRGRIASCDPAVCGIVVLGLGKLGGHELNYSSDVDLVVLVDLERARAAGIDQAAAVRFTQRVATLLTERTAEGYVFRVDLRLRPDPASTPIAVSTRAAITYMQSRARAWERQAMIKARFVAGDATAAKTYLNAVAPSIWQSGYDFEAIGDTFAMREQIALVKGAGDVTLPGHNVKLGRGGIREIEFIVQTLQRVAGGRDRRLRGRGTVEMLGALSACGWIEAELESTLSRAYERLRKVEHRLQMVADEQTHSLPREAELPRLATMMRQDDFEPSLLATFEAVHRAFLDLPNLAARANPLLAATGPTGEVNGEGPAELEAHFERWLGACYPCLRTERARALLAELRPDLSREILASPDPAGALQGLDAFLARLTRGIEALSRLALHRELIPVLVLILAAAPRLAEQLARRAHLLDVLIDPAFFGHLPDAPTLSAELQGLLEREPSYEGKLDVMRVFGQEQTLLVEVRVLVGALEGRSAAEAITRLAEVLVAAALSVAEAEFAGRHGRLAGGACCLLALGKLGSAEMTAASDLDLVFLYEAAPDAGESDGAKPLSPGHYYTRLAQRFIAALSAPTARGTLYEVDLRLRPSGRAGPIATHIRSFERYQRESAWVWEQMALTRARVVAGDAALGKAAMSVVREALGRPRDAADLAAAVAEMREKIAATGRTDLKRGEGALVDIEFIAQFLCLREGLAADSTDTRRILRALSAAGALSADDLETLLGALILMQKLSQLFAIAGPSTEVGKAPVALQGLLVRAGEAPDVDFLTADLTARRHAVREIFDRLVSQPAAATVS